MGVVNFENGKTNFSQTTPCIRKNAKKKPLELNNKGYEYSDSKFCFTELFLMSQLQRPDPLEETCCASSACVLTARLENAINKMPVASQWLLAANREGSRNQVLGGWQVGQKGSPLSNFPLKSIIKCKICAKWPKNRVLWGKNRVSRGKNRVLSFLVK